MTSSNGTSGDGRQRPGSPLHDLGPELELDELRVPPVHRYLEERTNATIAADLGLAESTVRRRVRKGVNQVRAMRTKRGLTVPEGLLATAPGSLVLFDYVRRDWTPALFHQRRANRCAGCRRVQGAW